MSFIKTISGALLNIAAMLTFGYMAVQTDNNYKFVLVVLSAILTSVGMYLYAEGVN
jgi:hypothetical protein